MIKLVPAAADTRVLTCYRSCKGTRQVYTRMLASSPVYSCGGCGASREIHELGGPGVAGQVDPILKKAMEKPRAPLAATKEMQEDSVVGDKPAKMVKEKLRASIDRSLQALKERAARAKRTTPERKLPMPKPDSSTVTVKLDASPIRKLIEDKIDALLAGARDQIMAEMAAELEQVLAGKRIALLGDAAPDTKKAPAPAKRKASADEDAPEIPADFKCPRKPGHSGKCPRKPGHSGKCPRKPGHSGKCPGKWCLKKAGLA